MGPADKARLAWRCRRGMLELDLLLQGFLDQAYEGLGREQQQCFERLLALPDQSLFDYLIQQQDASETEFADVIARIRAIAAP